MSSWISYYINNISDVENNIKKNFTHSGGLLVPTRINALCFDILKFFIKLWFWHPIYQLSLSRLLSEWLRRFRQDFGNFPYWVVRYYYWLYFEPSLPLRMHYSSSLLKGSLLKIKIPMILAIYKNGSKTVVSNDRSFVKIGNIAKLFKRIVLRRRISALLLDQWKAIRCSVARLPE